MTGQALLGRASSEGIRGDAEHQAPLTTQVVHELPGRLRLRLSGEAALFPRAAAALQQLVGVQSARLNPRCRSLTVTFDEGAALRRRILAVVADPPPVSTPASQPTPLNTTRLSLAAFSLATSTLLSGRTALLITLANILPTLATGLVQSLRRGICVEMLDAIAVGMPTLRGQYRTANFTHFLVELADTIEASTSQHSDALLLSLLQRSPPDVRVEVADGAVQRLPYGALQGGEKVLVGTGEAVPVDGEVLRGDAYVDQSIITGESVPIPLSRGATALAGGIVVDGSLLVRADRIGQDTTSGRVSQFILESLATPAQVESAAQRFADRRVAITLGSAAAVFALTRDWRRIESVFQVDYSCTVRLGVPVALKTAMYRAAQQGSLVKNGQAIESLAKVDTVVFDKTGTLTHNSLQVTGVYPLVEGVTQAQVTAVVASLGEHTTHPIANAVVRLAREYHLAHVAHDEVKFIVGHGVEARIGKDHVQFGSERFLEDDEKISFAAQRALVERLLAEGQSLLFVACNHKPLAVFALSDRLREESAQTLTRLRHLGVKQIVMLTGDRKEKALAFGQELGIDQVFYEQQPRDKAAVIAKLKAQGAHIAYVGDGVNDGPSLVEAQVGIAMPQAADIARASADILLTGERLDSLAEVVEIAQKTMALIHSNFYLGVGVNSSILAAAVFGLLSPIAAAALHNGTTVAILLRAMLDGQGSAKPTLAACRTQD